MPGFTAKIFELENRGVLQQDTHADIIVFDVSTVDKAATFAKLVQPAKGIGTVIVNKSVVWRDEKPSGSRPVRVLKGT